MSRYSKDPDFVPFLRTDYVKADAKRAELSLKEGEIMCCRCYTIHSKWRHGRVGEVKSTLGPENRWICNLCKRNRLLERAGRPKIAVLGVGRRKLNVLETHVSDGTLPCPQCKQSRPEIEFRIPAETELWSDWCFSCRDSHEAPGRGRNSRHFLKWREREEFVVSRGGVCEVCGKGPAEGFKLHVDYCHETGYVRGLLCLRHNNALGMCSDDPAQLRALADYIERHAEKAEQFYEENPAIKGLQRRQ